MKKVMSELKQALIDDKLISNTNLITAEEKAQLTQEPLSNILIQSGFISEETLVKYIGEKMHIPYVNLHNYVINQKAIDLIPEKIVRRYKIIPLFLIEDVLTIAMANPLDIISVDDISAVAGLTVETVISSEESTTKAIDKWYGSGEAKSNLIEEITEELEEIVESNEVQQNKYNEILLKKEASEAPIIKLVNTLIAQAILERSSDIHIRPTRNSLSVLFRIDGFLYNREELAAKLIAPMTSRIKIMSGLDISKRSIPQDGRISLTVRDKLIDVRTSTFPSLYGENVVLRILDKSSDVPLLSHLGFSNKDLVKYSNLIKETRGIILATGPTGSGKTTTLYSTVNSLDKSHNNIMTVEDPVEYEMEGIVQGQINPKVGLTFAEAFRSILRQDPDIIYVGEIRDFETAEMTIRAALTGHLVFSTLHTNDAVGAIPRLLDMGVEPRLLETVLKGAFAQRLIRKLCVNCKQEYKPDNNILESLGLPSHTVFYEPKGCNICSGIGYKGRVGIFEVLINNHEIKNNIIKQSSPNEMLKSAKKHGMTTMFEDGLQKVVDGITTLEEVERVILEA
jgi:type IV pilus assembly protein PilB